MRIRSTQDASQAQHDAFVEENKLRIENRRKWFRLGFALSSYFLSFAGGHAQSRTDCNVINSRILKQAVHYCVQLPPDYDARDSTQRRYPVLYFLHGLGQNEQTLFSTGGWSVIEDLRRQHKIEDFLVVAPEGKRKFLHQLARQFVPLQRFLSPGIHASHRKQISRSPGTEGRAITGVSMGGYGALRFAFAHPELFSAVSAQSAALITQTPQELSDAGHSGTPLGRLMGPAFGEPINVRTGSKTVFSSWPETNAAACEIWRSTSIAASRTISDLRMAPPPCTGNSRRKA